MKNNENHIFSKKEAIIQHIYIDWKETSEENRCFSEENIQKCSEDLDNFIRKMQKYQQNNAPQSDYAEAIYEICENLATFNQEDEEPEYLHGFLYDIYTEELSDFIRETAFEHGFELPETEIIATNVFSLRHSSEFRYEYFSVYIGEDDQNGISLLYDSDRHRFEYNENPYGDAYSLPIYNFRGGEAIHFEVLSQGRYRNIKLVAQHPQDGVWLKMLAYLHQNSVFPTFPDRAPADFCDIELETKRGKIATLRIINKDDKGYIIPEFQKGAGIEILTYEVNEKGELQSEYLVNRPKAVDKKLFLFGEEPYGVCFEVVLIAFKDDFIEVTIKNKPYQCDADDNPQIANAHQQTFAHQLKTFPFMKDFLKEIINLNTKNIL